MEKTTNDSQQKTDEILELGTYTSAELCRLMNISNRTLHNWRKEQIIPHCKLQNGHYSYPKKMINEWLKSHYQTPINSNN
jgi:predicted site-specific integrase-resolvase